MDYQYVRESYGVPAEYGRIVTVNGQSGVIAECKGNYIGVLFDSDKPNNISVCHPTSEVEYGGMGKVRKMTKSQQRYRDYIKVADCFDNFAHYLRYLTTQRNSY
jgi:hypothetical protein